MTTFTIPAELVPLALSGIHLDMRGVLDEASTLIEAAGREEPSAYERYLEELARVEASCALLDELEWRAGEQPAAIELDLAEHRPALLGALRIQGEAEQGHIESLPDPAGPVRRRAQENAASLTDTIRHAEKLEVVPADRGDQGLGIEYLIVNQLLRRDHPEEWTRRELAEELGEEAAPEAFAAALGRLRAAGAVVRDGERVRPSRCVLFLGRIGIVGF
jgi:hypothetical protein